MRLARWRMKWLIEHLTWHEILWCIDSFVLRNPAFGKPRMKLFININHSPGVKVVSTLPRSFRSTVLSLE